MLLARAEVVDAIRLWLPSQNRAHGMDSICAAVQFDTFDVEAALDYLRRRGEVMHFPHTGWRALPLATRRRINEALAAPQPQRMEA